MLNQNHPDDERLAELASENGDATVDSALTAHVSSCDRCTDLVRELGALRIALGDLPDLQPSRPLRLIPPVEADRERAADRAGGWARRFFAPVLTAGAALALVGTIGTVGTSTTTFQNVGADSAAMEELAEPEASGAAAPAMASSGADQFGAAGGEAEGASPLAAEDTTRSTGDGSTLAAGDEGDAPASAAVSAERSPWPMVLFVGVALMVAAAGLRWILAPRAP